MSWFMACIAVAALLLPPPNQLQSKFSSANQNENTGDTQLYVETNQLPPKSNYRVRYSIQALNMQLIAMPAMR